MKNGIRGMFSSKKRSSAVVVVSNNHTQEHASVVYSPSSSVSSFTSSDASSNASLPQTPTTQTVIQETRGIFRILEPVWYFQSNLLQKPGATTSNNDWIRFDEYSQYTLESCLANNNQSECILQQSSLGPCTISLKSLPPKSNKNSKKNNRQSMMPLGGVSLPTLTSRIPTYELNKQIRRTISPAWWFEQDSPDGSKGMCRFDYKNQVRLEALSEGRTRLVLTDDAFPLPFTVVLEPPQQSQLQEEVRGFLYLESVSSAFQLAYNAAQSTNKFSDYIQQDELYGSSEFDDSWASSPVRRNSI